MGKRVGVVILAALVAVGVWAAWTFDEAHRHMARAQTEIAYAQGRLLAHDPARAREAIRLAKDQTQAAAALTDSWVWRVLAAVPKFGDSPAAARSVILAADTSIDGIRVIATSFAGIGQEPIRSLDLVPLAATDQVVAASAGAVSRARAQLDSAPRAEEGDWVLPSIERAGDVVEARIDGLASTTAVVQEFGEHAAPLLGADEPRSYLVAVRTPNQMTATGGVVDLWGVVQVDDGVFRVVDSGAGEDLRLRINASPDFPAVAKSWVGSYEKGTGTELDGALALEVTAPVFGGSVTLPDGTVVSDAREFLLAGIYTMYPAPDQDRARRDARAAIAESVVEAAFTADLPTLERLVRDRQIMLWVRDPKIQEAIAGTELGHALQPAGAHTVEPVLINTGGSRLDRTIVRVFDYTVGRCPAPDGTVRSEVTMRYRIGMDRRWREAMVGAVRVGPNGPISRMRLKVYLPPGAKPVAVLVGGEGHAWAQSQEAGRPVVSLSLVLPPKALRAVKIEFDEPDSPAPGRVEVQPMLHAAGVVVEDRPCNQEQA